MAQLIESFQKLNDPLTSMGLLIESIEAQLVIASRGDPRMYRALDAVVQLERILDEVRTLARDALNMARDQTSVAG